MMPSFEHRQDDFILEGRTGSISGTAVFDVATEYDLSGDIGGRDGWAVMTCELLHIEIDGICVCDRDTAIGVVGRDVVERIERSMAEAVDDTLPELVAAE